MSEPIVDGFNLDVDLGENDYFVRYLDHYKDQKINKKSYERFFRKRLCCKKKKHPI